MLARASIDLCIITPRTGTIFVLQKRINHKRFIINLGHKMYGDRIVIDPTVRHGKPIINAPVSLCRHL